MKIARVNIDLKEQKRVSRCETRTLQCSLASECTLSLAGK